MPTQPEEERRRLSWEDSWKEGSACRLAMPPDRARLKGVAAHSALPAAALAADCTAAMAGVMLRLGGGEGLGDGEARVVLDRVRRWVIDDREAWQGL